jgi:hypothetical protein
MRLAGGATSLSLLEENPVLARSIRLRNPYVDPMSLIQVDLLRRKRASEESDTLNLPRVLACADHSRGCVVRGAAHESGRERAMSPTRP